MNYRLPLILGLIALLLLSGCPGGKGDFVCGNGICEKAENEKNCAADCKFPGKEPAKEKPKPGEKIPTQPEEPEKKPSIEEEKEPVPDLDELLRQDAQKEAENAIFYKSRTYTDVSSCSSLAEPDKTVCMTVVALNNYDVSICSNISGTTEKEICENIVWSRSGDDSVCEKVTSKELCYSQVAELKKDDSLCQKISKEMLRNSCFESVGEKSFNKESCEKIVNNEDMKNECIAIATSNGSKCPRFFISSCIPPIAQKLKDVKLCEELKKENWGGELYAAECKAIITRDLSHCNALEFKELRDSCYSTVKWKVSGKKFRCDESEKAIIGEVGLQLCYLQNYVAITGIIGRKPATKPTTQSGEKPPQPETPQLGKIDVYKFRSNKSKVEPGEKLDFYFSVESDSKLEAMEIDWGDEKKESTGCAGATGCNFESSHSYSSEGTYTIKGTVLAEDGRIESKTIQVIVRKETPAAKTRSDNQAPQISVSVVKRTPKPLWPGQAVQFHIKMSDDEPNFKYTFSGEGIIAYGGEEKNCPELSCDERIYANYYLKGDEKTTGKEFTFKARAFDSFGDSSEIPVTVKVDPMNQAIGNLKLRVQESVGGDPLEGMEVAVTKVNSGIYIFGTTNSQGEVTLNDLEAPAQYYIVVSDPDQKYRAGQAYEQVQENKTVESGISLVKN